MRAFQVLRSGQPPELVDLPKPVPGLDEVLLRIESCGLNFADLLMAKGTYQDTPDVPFTLGLEVCGIVEAVGTDVADIENGQRVAIFGGQGGMAEFGVFPAKRCVAIPNTINADIAASFQVAYGTSHLALTRRANLQPGETLMVLGASGGVGLTAVEIGRRIGAKVIAVARGAEKLAIAKAAGADVLIDSSDDDLIERVKQNGGADVVYDPVGGELFTAAIKCCNREARVLSIGFASGEVPPVRANVLLVKNITLIGFYWGGYLAFNTDALTQSIEEIVRWLDAGELRPHISHSIPLSEAQTALDLMAERKSTGKIVIRP